METITKETLGRPILTTSPKIEPPSTKPEDSNPELINSADELKERLATKILDYVAEIGIEANIPAIRRRLEEATLTFSEPDTQTSERILKDGYLAVYNAPNRLATVPLQSGEGVLNPVEPRVMHSVVHELFHAASGQVFMVREGRIDNAPNLKAIGLERRGDFSWLNEALTEDLTINFMKRMGMDTGEAENRTYVVPRLILAEIFDTSGIPKSTFLEAYFEEPDFSASPGERMPKWHNLQDALTAEFGPHFLRRVTDGIPHKYTASSLFTRGKKGKTTIERLKDEWQSKRARQKRISGFVGGLGLKGLASRLQARHSASNARFTPRWRIEYNKQRRENGEDV